MTACHDVTGIDDVSRLGKGKYTAPGKKAVGRTEAAYGSHDEKKVIPERYKAGPISSAYVMQDEITALKAENARMQADGEKLSAAYSELNEMYKKVQKDNEEIKRQLAYLMERVKG